MAGQRRIGVLTPLVGGFYFGSLIAGVHERAQKAGYQTLVVQTAGGGVSPQGELKQPLAWDQADGWVTIVEAVPTDYLQRIRQSGRPLVTVSLVLPELDCPAVLPDNRGGMQEAVRHLIAHGHRRIAFVGNMPHEDIRQRYTGYQAALAEAGLPLDEQLLFEIDNNMKTGGEAAAQRMLADGLPCTAVVAATDLNAIGMIETLQKAGYRLPEDLAIIGFDDIEAAEYLTPPLTSVRQRFDHLGSAAAEQLLEQLAGAPARHAVVYVPTALVQRRSCGCSSRAGLLEQPARQQPQSWQETLHEQILRLALHPVPLPAGRTAAEIWPGGATITEAMQAAVDGRPAASSSAIFEAWGQLIDMTLELDAIDGIITLLEQTGKQRLAATPAANEEPVQRFLGEARVELLRARLGSELARVNSLERTIQTNYHIGLTLLGEDAGSARKLGWMWSTPIRWGCLGLWQPGSGGDAPELDIVGTYSRDKRPTPPLNSRMQPQAFPPVDYLPEPDAANRQDPLILLPLRTATRDWGVLALASPVDTRFSGGFDTLSQWATLLTAALQREELQASFEAQQRDLHQAYERERMLANTVRELGCPIIPLMRNVILVPLIGALDPERAQQLLEGILNGIGRQQASVVLIDITGVPVVDTQVASSLVQTTRAASLLGASTVLVGMRPEIAQSIISLGIDLSSISTYPSLASAIEALQRQPNSLAQLAGRSLYNGG